MRSIFIIHTLLLLSLLTLFLGQQTNPAQDSLPKDSGLYYRSDSDYIKLQGSCNIGEKIHSFGARNEFVYKDARATFQIGNHRPTFVFVGRDTSPMVRHEFSLVAMISKKHERRVEFRMGGVISNQLELITNRTNLISTLTPAADLKAGEYLLGVFEGVSDATVGNLTACGFNFGVQEVSTVRSAEQGRSEPTPHIPEVSKVEVHNVNVAPEKANERSTAPPTLIKAYIGASSDANPNVRSDGVTITSVVLGSPADKAGIKAGDVIVAINDHYLYTVNELMAEVSRYQPGTTVTVRYRRYLRSNVTSLLMENEPLGSTNK